MAKQFPRPKPGATPTKGGADELLEAPPEGEAPLGSIAAYRAGSKTRRWVFGTLIVGTISALFIGRWYMNHLDEQRHHQPPVYTVDPELLDELTREVHWDSGTARLGLSREPPGVEAIVLPDRVLRLAEGHDHAQVKVTVVDGRTEDIKVLVGRIVQHPRTE